VPESRRRKKSSSPPPSRPGAAHEETPSGRWVPITGSILLILGLLWIVTFYIAGGDIPVMNAIDNWNLLVGMGLIVAGFLVFTKWR
jgi:hypothetical protein